MKNRILHIKTICLTAGLLLMMSTGNGLKAQSIDKEYDEVNTLRQNKEIVIKVYPNPATDYVVVSTESKFEGKFKLNNIFGKVLLEGELNSEGKNIDLLKYRTGIYIISIYDEMDKKVSTRKIIKN